MTNKEFLEPYLELAEHFGQQAFSAKRGKLIFKVIEELPAEWWRMIAHRMILSNDGRFDIYSAAKSELGSIRQQRRLEDEIGAIHTMSRLASENGLGGLLKQFGAASLWEAIEKGKAE